MPVNTIGALVLLEQAAAQAVVKAAARRVPRDDRHHGQKVAGLDHFTGRAIEHAQRAKHVARRRAHEREMAAGRVYGFVYSGLDLGATVGPGWFGLMLDHGQGREMFYVVAVLLALAVGTVVRVRRAIVPA